METAVRQGAKVYVDDEYYYELLGTKMFVWSIGNGPVQLVRNVSNVFKSQGVVIQYTDGAIATVRRRAVKYEWIPQAVAINKTKMVVWFALDDPPVVESIGVAGDSTDMSATQTLIFGKIVKEIGSRRAAIVTSAFELVERYDTELESISARVDELMASIYDAKTKERE